MWTTPQTRPAQASLTSAWLFYRQSSGFANQQIAMVTSHDVFSVEGRPPTLGPGTVVDKHSVAKAFEQIQGRDLIDHEHSGLLDANVLQFDSKKLTWFVPGKVRPMWFARSKGTDRLDVAWPSLVFHVSERYGFRIWATRSKRRPTSRTPLFHTPLANIYAQANVCFGQADKGDLTLESRPVWEAAIFDTRFSHVNQDYTLRPEACGLKGKRVSTAAHMRFWRAMARDKSKTFPSKALSPFHGAGATQLKLGEVLP